MFQPVVYVYNFFDFCRSLSDLSSFQLQQQAVRVLYQQQLLVQPPPCSDAFSAIQAIGWIHYHAPSWIAAFIQTPPLGVRSSTPQNLSCYQVIEVRYWLGRGAARTEISPFWIKCMFSSLNLFPYPPFSFVGHTCTSDLFLLMGSVHSKADLALMSTLVKT